MDQIQASRAANAVKSPSGLSWAVQAGEQEAKLPLDAITKAISWFGEGGSFQVQKPTLIGVGEKGRETVTVTPGDVGTTVSQGAGGGRAELPAAGGSGVQVVINMAGANFIGAPTPAHVEVWAKALAMPIAQRIGESLYTTLHTAKH
jgi:hypothetical protein